MNFERQHKEVQSVVSATTSKYKRKSVLYNIGAKVYLPADSSELHKYDKTHKTNFNTFGAVSK